MSDFEDVDELDTDENEDGERGLFEFCEDDFLAFEKIPVGDRRHSRPDLCAFLYLHEKLGGEHDMVRSAEHDEIWLDYEEEDAAKLSLDDLIYLHRCGVRHDSDTGRLCMFV